MERKHPLIMINKMLWLGILMIILAKFFFSWFSNNYQFMLDNNDDRCIPEYSFYFVNKSELTVQRGQIYAFSAHGLTPFFKDGQTMGKYAIGVAGDHIVINKQGVFVNGKKIVTGFPVIDKLHIKETELYKNFVVPDGQVFFAGTAERSFDSRYWGTASINQVIGKANPLW